MPHAETTKTDSTNMSPSQMTNGESGSAFISHLNTYPVVSDTVNTYKTNPLGRKSLDIANIAYDKLAAPFLPYLRTPYSIVHPYVSKADSIADSGLTKVDKTFPVVKEDTKTVFDSAVHLAFLPLILASRSKDYAFSTYNDEHKKVGGEQGLVRSTKALISTEIRMALEAFSYAVNFLSERKEEASEKAQKFTNDAAQKADHLSKEVKHKADHTAKEVKHKADHKSQEAKQKVDQHAH